MKPSALAVIKQILNGHIQASTAASERLAELAGKSLAIDVIGPGVTLLLSAQDGELDVDTAADGVATATVRGTPLALLASLRGDSLSGFHASGIQLTGDAEVAEEFSALLRLARPDLEEQLAHVTGDVLAHQAGNVIRDLSAWGRQALDASRMNMSEFLQEESRQLPARVEVESFYSEIDRLRDAAERVSVSIDRQLSDMDEG